ncbi:transposase [Nocardia fluminea]|uniref:transposase n=1 Tax=Nocardia fluminea TaxID=134984 RepID=UPI00366D3A59
MAETVGDRHQVLTDNQWELLELLLPKSDGRVGRNFSNNRQVVEGMLFRLRTGMPWRDLPEVFGPWHRDHPIEIPGRIRQRGQRDQHPIPGPVGGIAAVTFPYRLAGPDGEL